MKKLIAFISFIAYILFLSGCSAQQGPSTDVLATTKPVYDFTAYLCLGTDITVHQLVTENVSCLHDYTLQSQQMRAIESAKLIVISGAGLEEFLHDVLHNSENIIDASYEIELMCGEHTHETEEGHHHDSDPHIWLSVKNARHMAENIYNGLSESFPEYQTVFQNNLITLQEKFDQLEAYGREQLSSLSTYNMITFHDGFSYFAEEWNLTILKALEEESGSEASAAELIELINLVRQYQLPAIFTEENSSSSAAHIIASETGIDIYTLNMGMSDDDYFEIMYHNIDTVKEALG